jgi:hypothetical protein
MSKRISSKCSLIIRIRTYLQCGDIHQAEILISDRYFKDAYIDIPCDTPTSMVILLKSRGFKVNLSSFTSGYGESEEELKIVVDNIQLTDPIPTISLRYTITRHYLRLMGIKHKLMNLDNVRMQEIPYLVAEGYGDELIIQLILSHRIRLIRLMYESGYRIDYTQGNSTSEYKILDFLKCYGYTIGDYMHEVIRFPLGWTDRIYYECSQLFFTNREFLIKSNSFYILFYDPAFKPFWEGLKRYIQAYPEVQLNPSILEYLHNGIIPHRVQEIHDRSSQNQIDYNLISFEKFCELITSRDGNDYDPHFIEYWERLSQPENRELLNKLMNENNSIIEYLDYKKLACLYDLTLECNSWRLLLGVVTGEFHYSQLPEGHPIRELLRSRNTKPAKR